MNGNVRGVLRQRMGTDRNMILKLQVGKLPPVTVKENTLKPKNTVDEILDALAAQQRQGETSLAITIEPDQIPDAMNLPGYRKLFAPVLPGQTDTAPIYAAYQQMRQAGEANVVLVFVECQTIAEFREALARLPLRKSSEWRAFSTTESAGPY